MTTEHFLVPVDFSAYSDYALDYALALAPKLQARLTLLHILQPLAVGGADMGLGLPYAYIQQLEEETRQSMQKCLDRVNATGLKGEGMVVHGIPWHEIVDIARSRRHDLIIMGTHGRTGLQHVLLGSVAEKVARLAPCPVLVVRLPAEQDT
jgi:universal stress protein A